MNSLEQQKSAGLVNSIFQVDEEELIREYKNLIQPVENKNKIFMRTGASFEPKFSKNPNPLSFEERIQQYRQKIENNKIYEEVGRKKRSLGPDEFSSVGELDFGSFVEETRKLITVGPLYFGKISSHQKNSSLFLILASIVSVLSFFMVVIVLSYYFFYKKA